MNDAVRAERKKAEVLHRRKLFQGRATAQEVHAKYAFPPGAKCTGCGKRGGLQTRAIVLMELEEMKRRDPLLADLSIVDPVKFTQLILQTKYGPFIRVSTSYACPTCTPALEKAMAKCPSYCIVDINRGPGADKVIG